MFCITKIIKNSNLFEKNFKNYKMGLEKLFKTYLLIIYVKSSRLMLFSSKLGCFLFVIIIFYKINKLKL